MLGHAGPDGVMIPDGGTFHRTPRGRNSKATGGGGRYPNVARGKLGSSDDVLTQLTRWGQLDRNRWDERNSRFQRDQQLYQLQSPEGVSAQISQDIITLNDPKVLVKKLARLIARHPNVIDVPAAPGTDGVSAQIIENWCYLIDQALNQR